METKNGSTSGRGLLGRVLPVVAALAVIGALFLTSPASASPEVNQLTDHITINQTTQNTWGCLPPVLALQQSTFVDSNIFRLRIRATANPCTPVTAHAVVYAMPGNGEAWPQTLLEKETFTITKTGVTDVIFSKDCDPMQFDVVTGATPPVISPLGPWHGPLLFPLDTSTALQYWGDPDCTTTTTTTPGGGCEDYIPTNVAISTATPSAGDVVTITGGGTPGETVTATLTGGPYTDEFLANATVLVSGQFAISATIPATAPPGSYTIDVTSEHCPTPVTISITVGAPPSALRSGGGALSADPGGSLGSFGTVGRFVSDHGPSSEPWKFAIVLGAGVLFIRLRQIRRSGAQPTRLS